MIAPDPHQGTDAMVPLGSPQGTDATVPSVLHQVTDATVPSGPYQGTGAPVPPGAPLGPHPASGAGAPGASTRHPAGGVKARPEAQAGASPRHTRGYPPIGRVRLATRSTMAKELNPPPGALTRQRGRMLQEQLRAHLAHAPHNPPSQVLVCLQALGPNENLDRPEAQHQEKYPKPTWEVAWPPLLNTQRKSLAAKFGSSKKTCVTWPPIYIIKGRLICACLGHQSTSPPHTLMMLGAHCSHTSSRKLGAHTKELALATTSLHLHTKLGAHSKQPPSPPYLSLYKDA